MTFLQKTQSARPSSLAARLNFTHWSPRTASLVSGVALAIMAVLAAVANFGAIVPLVTPGDAAATTQAIRGAEPLFVTGVILLFMVTLLDILVAGAWYALFRDVHRTVAAVAAWTRTVFAVAFMVAIGQLVAAVTHLDEPAVVLRSVEAFTTIWVTSLGLFGIHLLLIGYLAWRSGFVPRVLGGLLGLAGVGYLADAIGITLVEDFSAVFAQYLFVGEVAIIFWLLIRGRRLGARSPRQATGPRAR